MDFIDDWVVKAKEKHPGSRCHAAIDKHAQDVRRRHADDEFYNNDDAIDHLNDLIRQSPACGKPKRRRMLKPGGKGSI
jgi:hypothetical protein